MKKTGERGRPVIAVDIGGTKISMAVISPDGAMLAGDTCPTLAEDGVSAVVARLCEALGRFMEKNSLDPSRLAALGIACAGGIDTPRGVVVTPSPNLPDWSDVPLADMMEKRFGVDAFLVNDASAAALGEHRYGAGAGVNNMVLFTVGTGIGGGIIADGKLYLGAVGAAGELGHMTVAADGPRCGCGNTGCLEMLASGRAVERDAVERLRRGEKSVLAGMVGGDIESVTAKQVGEAALSGDALALDILSRAAYYLGIGMVNVVNIFNPEMIVVGGGMSDLGDLLIGPGRRLVKERAFSVSSRAVRVVTACLGNEAGVYGAAAFAFEQVRRRTR